jgi:hypothetical protein
MICNHFTMNFDRDEFTLHRKENRDDFQALRNGLDQLNQNFIKHLTSHNEQD